MNGLKRSVRRTGQPAWCRRPMLARRGPRLRPRYSAGSMVGRMMAGSAGMSFSRARLRSRVAREHGFYVLAADHSVQSMSVPIAAPGLLRLEPITDPRFGQDMFRMGGVCLDLLTNLI